MLGIVFKNVFKKVNQTVSLVWRKILARIDYYQKLQVVHLQPKQPNGKNVLLSYRIEPFLLQAAGKPIPNDQSWNWECLLIAQTFLDMGYSVDVIQFHNEEFVPKKDYAFFIDIRNRMQALAPLLNPDCIKIFHVDIANMIFRNAAECNRLLDLQRRKGVTLCPQRYEVPNLGIEYADCATVLGNNFTVNTFKYANKPMYRTPISSSSVYPWKEEKDFDAVKKNFLWFGGSALLLKGLDLALDAFAEMPDYHLTVCGPVSNDKEFQKAYYKELYETPNIHTIGWVDVQSQEFFEITQKCLGLVYPSACEGQAGAVITCLQAGLLPILSYESGVDVHDFGAILDNCSIPQIKVTVQNIANQPVTQLKAMSHKAWEYARKNHTKEQFALSYRHAVEDMLKNHKKSNNIQTATLREKAPV